MDIIAVIDKLDELGLLRKSKVIGDYYQIYCPIHNGGNERKPSCGVLIHSQRRNGSTYPEGWVHCFSCGLAKPLTDVIDQVLKNRGIKDKSGLDYLKELFPNLESSDFEYLLPKDLVAGLNDKFAVDYVKTRLCENPQYITEEELSSYRYTIPYMYDRKLTDEIISKFDVGVDVNYVPRGRKDKMPTITFPVKDRQGNVLFIYRRSIKTKHFFMPKYLEKPIYGICELPKECPRLVICESIFNALTCWVYGWPSVALFGTGTPLQIKELKTLGVKEFIIGTDPDEAGDRAAEKLKRSLKSVGIVRRMNLPEGKDINDLTREEFDKAMEERS